MPREAVLFAKCLSMADLPQPGKPLILMSRFAPTCSAIIACNLGRAICVSSIFSDISLNPSKEKAASASMSGF